MTRCGFRFLGRIVWDCFALERITVSRTVLHFLLWDRSLLCSVCEKLAFSKCAVESGAALCGGVGWVYDDRRRAISLSLLEVLCEVGTFGWVGTRLEALSYISVCYRSLPLLLCRQHELWLKKSLAAIVLKPGSMWCLSWWVLVTTRVVVV